MKFIIFCLICQLNYSNIYAQTNEENVFWLKDKLKANARNDKFGKSIYLTKIDQCILGLGSISTIYALDDAFISEEIFGVYLKDIFLIQTQINNRDCRIKLRTKQEVINYKVKQTNEEKKVDEIILYLKKDAIDNGEFENIVSLLIKIIKSCGGNAIRQEY